MTNPTPLEVLSYLTDGTFVTVVVVLVTGTIILNALNRIGGRR